MVAASLYTSSSWPSTDRPRRQAGRRCRRAEGKKWESPTPSTALSRKSSPPSPSLVAMVCLLVVVACCSTSCVSFTMPRQRMTRQPSIISPFQTEGPQSGTSDRLSFLKPSPPMTTSLFSEAATATLNNNESSEENVSNNNGPKIVDDDNDNSLPSSPSSPMDNPAFNDAAESPAPPLNYEKYLTMQKKRVSVTIRYSAGSGLKPYYLTVAKRVKDQYPDVLIERVEVAGEGEALAEGDASKTSGAGSFEVVVDGKIVVRTNNQRATGTHTGSIFVSMTEMDLAISRARKRRRPSTVYGENGIVDGMTNEGGGSSGDREINKVEILKQKAMELQQRPAATEL